MLGHKTYNTCTYIQTYIFVYKTNIVFPSCLHSTNNGIKMLSEKCSDHLNAFAENSDLWSIECTKLNQFQGFL